MSRRLSALAALAIATAGGGSAGAETASAFCMRVSRVASEAGLQMFDDGQLQNGLCMASREVALAIGEGDGLTQDLCTAATMHLLQEFKARFPNRDAASVSGRC